MEAKRPFSFDVEELQELLLDPCSLVRAKRSIRHIALHPSSLGDLKAAIKRMLNQLLNKFDPNFGGILLGYKNVIVTSSKGTVLNDDYNVHFDIEADFYIFTPEVGCVLFGFVNKKSRDHIGCLVHKFFNVSILRPSKESGKEWLGESVGIGDKVTFSLKLCDLTGNLPYMQGTLMSSSPAKENMEVQSPKKKKHKITDSTLEDTQDEIFIASEIDIVQSNKRKRDSDDDVTKKKKKKKRKREEAQDDNQEQPNSLHMSSEDPEYGQIIQHIKEAYLKEDSQDEPPKKEKKKHNKRKLYVVSDGTVGRDSNEEEKVLDKVDASEQVESKKKRHESESEVISILPDFNTLWKNFEGRRKKLEENLDVSLNNTSPEIATSRRLSESQKEVIENEGPLTKHKSKKDTSDSPKKHKKKIKEQLREVIGNEPVTKHEDKKDTSGSPKKHKKKAKEVAFKESNLDVSSDKIGLEDHWNLPSQFSDETQTLSPSKLNTSNLVSPKKQKKKDKVAQSVLDISPLKTSHDTSGAEKTSPVEQNTLSPFSIDDNLPMITQKVAEKSRKNDRTMLLDSLTRMAAVYGDSDESEEDSSKLNNPKTVRISENSPFYKLAASMANSSEQKRPKLSKGNTTPERRSLPFLKQNSVDDDMAHFENLLSPLTPVNISPGEKKKKSVSYDNQVHFFTPENVLGSNSKSKKSPEVSETLERAAIFQTPSAKKTKKQKKSPEETSVSRKRSSSAEKLELSNVKSTKDKDISSGGTDFSSNSFVLPDLSKILKVWGSPSSGPKTPSKQAAGKSTSETKSSSSKEISEVPSNPSKKVVEKTNVNSKKDKTKEKSKTSGKKKKKDKKHKKQHSDEKVKKKTSHHSSSKKDKKKKKDEASDVIKLSDELLQKFLNKK